MAEVLTLEEAAKFLKLHEETVLKYFKRGVIPGRKIGRQYRFSSADLLNWVTNGCSNPTTS